MSERKMSAGERIEAFLDADSFVEIGRLVQTRSTDYNMGAKKASGDGVITGYGTLNGRMVCVYSQDAAVLGGSVGEMHAKKIAALYDMAMRNGCPVVGMMDCAGLRLQEAGDALFAFGSLFRKQAEASGRIPQLCGIFGQCGGGSAVMAALSDFVFLEKNKGSLFVNSPNTLGAKAALSCDTAGYAFQSEQAGNVDFVCDGDGETIEKMRLLLDLLPANAEARDAVFEGGDDVNRVAPELNGQGLDAAAILRSISDRNLYLETKENYANDVITAFLRLDGQTVGAVANRGGQEKPALSADGMEKAARFVRFCDAFSLPVLVIADVHGMAALQEEERRLSGAAARLCTAFSSATTPRITLIAGEAYGTAGILMNSKALGADVVLAWPEASVGMMDAEQAVRIMYADEMQAGNQMALIAEKTEEYRTLQGSAQAAAGRGYVDDIICPDATRKRLCAAFSLLERRRPCPIRRKHLAR